jgi:hypothetical protein
MVVATTRTRDQSPAFLFGGGRAPEASFADMVVSIPPDANRKIGEVEWPQQPPGDPARDFVTLKSEIITRDQVAATFSRLIGQSREKEALVFVHGLTLEALRRQRRHPANVGSNCDPAHRLLVDLSLWFKVGESRAPARRRANFGAAGAYFCACKIVSGGRPCHPDLAVNCRIDPAWRALPQSPRSWRR